VIGILDYGMGNISSVNNSLDYLGFETKIIQSLDDMNSGISHLIVPGVGSYSKAMDNLRTKKLDTLIYKFVKTGKPYLGICLGMQLLSSIGYEDGKTKGLDLIKGEVVPFDISLHIPHVGWNNIDCKKIHQVFGNQSDHLDFYFVHSYYFKASSSEDILTTTNYEIDFCSSIVKNNLIGVQFHPEKSQEPGLNFLEKFCTWDGKC